LQLFVPISTFISPGNYWRDANKFDNTSCVFGGNIVRYHSSCSSYNSNLINKLNYKPIDAGYIKSFTLCTPFPKLHGHNAKPNK
jgi:putative component of membrane protein insertase Oxa1/YidC/SpoIIIJ protein YidD